MKLSLLIRCFVMASILFLIGRLGEHLYLSACMIFLMSRLLLSGWIAVVSPITLMDVDFMDPVIIRNALFCTLSNV